MKGLLLCGGTGARLRPLTYTQPKQLLPLANKPVIFYAIESLLKANIRELGIIVGDMQNEFEKVLGDGTRWGSDVSIRYLRQEGPLGLAHAVRVAQPFLRDEKFVMFLGDNFLTESLASSADEFASANCPYHCKVLLKEVSNPQQFGVAELEKCPVLAGNQSRECLSPRVTRLIEKPSSPTSNLALTGIYFFDHHIFEAAQTIRCSARGELEITDAIQWLIDRKHDVRSDLLQGYWADTGDIDNFLKTNNHVLETLSPAIDRAATVSPDSVLVGNVSIEAGVQIQNSVIYGPAIIGKGSIIRNSSIGPYTSIASHVLIEASDIESSVVLEHSTILTAHSRIENSIIGRHTEIRFTSPNPRRCTLLQGDYSKVSALPA